MNLPKDLDAGRTLGSRPWAAQPWTLQIGGSIQEASARLLDLRHAHAPSRKNTLRHIYTSRLRAIDRLV